MQPAGPDTASMTTHRMLELADEAQTAALGRALAGALAKDDLVLLSGPLGAGKSALARAIIRTRLVDPQADVPSPSYTLVNVYGPPNGSAIWHADLYRLSDASEVYELGLFDPLDALVLVEWPERAAAKWPARRLEIFLTPGAHADARRAEVTSFGSDWEAVMTAVAPWG